MDEKTNHHYIKSCCLGYPDDCSNCIENGAFNCPRFQNIDCDSVKRIKEVNKILNENHGELPSDMALASDLQCATYYRNQLCRIHRVLNPIVTSK
jgi:hypothetical protein